MIGQGLTQALVEPELGENDSDNLTEQHGIGNFVLLQSKIVPLITAADVCYLLDKLIDFKLFACKIVL